MVDEKSQYEKMFDDLGDSHMKEEINLFKDMYVGKNNTKRQAVNTSLNTENFDGLENPPFMAVNPEFPNESYDSDEEEKKFFVDESEDETEGYKSSKERFKEQSNPSKTKDTAPRGTETPFDVSSSKKEIGRQSAKEVQARIANAKNLTEVMVKKSLLDPSEAPNMVKLITSLDNRSFGLIKNIVSKFQSKTSERQVSASTQGLETPLHVSKPIPRGNSLVEAFEGAPWIGVPDPTFDLKKYI